MLYPVQQQFTTTTASHVVRDVSSCCWIEPVLRKIDENLGWRTGATLLTQMGEIFIPIGRLG
jgi:hypothetical protein